MHLHASLFQINTGRFFLTSECRHISLFVIARQQHVCAAHMSRGLGKGLCKGPILEKISGHFERKVIQRPEGFERLKASRKTIPDPSVPTNSNEVLKDVQYQPKTGVSAVPTTPWELVYQLRLLVSPPGLPFSRFTHLHRKYPHLHSVESYNFILALSIRHGLSSGTRGLIDSMAAMHIQPNTETEQLVVRYTVSSGFWMKAWQQVMKRYGSVQAIPMPVLLELLAPSPRDHFQPRLLSKENHIYARPSPRPVKKHEGNDQTPSTVSLDPMLLLMHRFPGLPLSDLAQLPPRVVSYVVRALLRSGHEEAALVITRNHILTLPERPTFRRIHFARTLIHLHLSVGQVKLANHKRKRRLVESLFALHSDLEPNAQTTSLLIRFMARSMRCGIEAYVFYKTYRACWGHVVDNLTVRRRIIQYATKQRKLGIAHEIATMEPPRISEPPVERLGSDNLLPAVPAWRTMYPRHGRDRRYWKRVIYRLLQRRRSATAEWKKNKGNKENILKKHRHSTSNIILPTA